MTHIHPVFFPLFLLALLLHPTVLRAGEAGKKDAVIFSAARPVTLHVAVKGSDYGLVWAFEDMAEEFDWLKLEKTCTQDAICLEVLFHRFEIVTRPMREFFRYESPHMVTINGRPDRIGWEYQLQYDEIEAALVYTVTVRFDGKVTTFGNQEKIKEKGHMYRLPESLVEARPFAVSGRSLEGVELPDIRPYLEDERGFCPRRLDMNAFVHMQMTGVAYTSLITVLGGESVVEKVEGSPDLFGVYERKLEQLGIWKEDKPEYNALTEMLFAPSYMVEEDQVTAVYTTTALPEEEAWQNIRKHRDSLLAECDWTAGVDIPATIRSVYEPYRQALRDIPQSYTSAQEVVFLPKP